MSLCLLLCVAADLQVLVADETFEIGQPIHCEVALDELDVGEDALELDRFDPDLAWFVAEAPAVHRSAEGARSLRWTVLALEPEPGPLPTPRLSLDGEALTLDAPSISVAAALDPGEDSPRPARGFYIPELEGAETSALPLILSALAALAAGFIGWRALARRTPDVPEAPTLATRFAALARPMDGEDPSVGDWHGELAHLLRAAHGDDQSGWSDEEWVERAELSAEQRAELRSLFEVCAAVRYGGARPTRFAIEETLARARALMGSAEEVAA